VGEDDHGQIVDLYIIRCKDDLKTKDAYAFLEIFWAGSGLRMNFMCGNEKDEVDKEDMEWLVYQLWGLMLVIGEREGIDVVEVISREDDG